MSIRRASQQLAYDENGDPYWQMDDDPEGSYVLYSDHLVEMENSWEEAYAQGYNRGRVDGESRSCALSYKYGYKQGVKAAREAVAAAPGAYSGYPLIERVKALAAIDALRGSGNPHTPPSAEKGEQA